MIEVWKDVPNYEGIYQVSNLGNVKSLNYRHTKKEKILKIEKNIHHCKLRDYIQNRVQLCKNGKIKVFLVHRLVWIAFNGNIPEGYEIDHIDNNSGNNCLSNLQLFTKSENLKKKFEDNKNFWPGRPKRKIKCLNNGIIYDSQKEASKLLNLNQGCLSEVLNGKKNAVKGYRFILV